MDELTKALIAHGPFGIICAVLIWRDFRRDEREDKRESARSILEDKRVEADKNMAVAITLLTERLK